MPPLYRYDRHSLLVIEKESASSLYRRETPSPPMLPLFTPLLPLFTSLLTLVTPLLPLFTPMLPLST